MSKARSVPSLVDLCVQSAINNVRYLGDVGQTEDHLLSRILPHCTVDQLTTIETSTKHRDLTPVTDKLWQGFYKLKFGVDKLNQVIDNMKQKKVSYRWKLLYHARLKYVEELMDDSGKRLKEKYKEEGDRKRSRQIQLCTKAPPAKRPFWGAGHSSNLNVANTKSPIMKKAKLQFLNCNEVKNLEAVKKNTVQKRPASLVTARKQPTASSSNFSASTSRFANSVGRRY